MKLNKTLMACILLLAIVTMGAACASENVSDDVAAIEDTGDEIAQSVDDVEITGNAEDSDDVLADDFKGVKASINNITAYDYHRIIVSREVIDKNSNGLMSVYVNEFSTDVPQFSVKVTDGLFPDDPDLCFDTDHLNIKEFKNYTISVTYTDYNDNSIHHLATEKITMTFLDSFYETDTIFDTNLYVRLIYGFNGTVSATINGIDVGELIFEDDSYFHCLSACLQLDPSVLRMEDNILVVSAQDPVMGKKVMQFKFNCTPQIINAKEFFTTRTFAHDPQFFSIGEEFKIGIRVPEVVTGKLNVYTGIYDEKSSVVNKGTFLATADIYDGTAVATISLSKAGYNDLYLEYDTNKGKGHVDTDEKIIDNNPRVMAKVSPLEFIVGDENVTVNFTSPEEGFLELYVDGDGNTTPEAVTAVNYTIPYLSIGKHIIRLKFEGANDTVYSKSFTVEVKQWVPTNMTNNTVPTRLTAPKVSATYNAARDLTITLRDDWGQILVGEEISVKVGSINKKIKTDGNGQVKINVATLAPKEYTATIRYAGDETYAPSNTTAKVVVSKAKPVITAAKKTFKSSDKTKKYTVTLKNGKNLAKNTKVTIKVNKKTYTAKTNSKGVATFKLNKLTKKGKYTATVKSVSNKYYNNSKAVNVKITVK